MGKIRSKHMETKENIQLMDAEKKNEQGKNN